jgi:hypothetical protein
MSINIDSLNFDGASSRGSGRESSEDRENRMRAFFARPENKVITEVGKLLATQVTPGVTLAMHIADGEKLDLKTSINIKGVTVKLAANQTLSLDTLANWACPACHSAHGSGYASSSEISAKLLATNRFFVDGNGKLFTISNTCFGSYVKALGFAKQIVQPSAGKAVVITGTKQLSA